MTEIPRGNLDKISVRWHTESAAFKKSALLHISNILHTILGGNISETGPTLLDLIFALVAAFFFSSEVFRSSTQENPEEQ